MNIDNLAVSQDYVHSRSKRAVIYSNNAEYTGNNFMAVYNEQ